MVPMPYVMMALIVLLSVVISIASVEVGFVVIAEPFPIKNLIALIGASVISLLIGIFLFRTRKGE